jgi:hypothetical protein
LTRSNSLINFPQLINEWRLITLMLHQRLWQNSF